MAIVKKQLADLKGSDYIALNNDNNIVSEVNDNLPDSDGKIKLAELLIDNNNKIYKKIPPSTTDKKLSYRFLNINNTLKKFSLDIKGIAYGNGIYICSGYYGSFLVSNNLENWEYVNFPFDVTGARAGGGAGVVFGEECGKFLATSGDTNAYWSFDGRNWFNTNVSMIINDYIREIYYCNGYYFIGTWNKGLWKSKDLVNWTCILDLDKLKSLVATTTLTYVPTKVRIFMITYFKGNLYVAEDTACLRCTDIETGIWEFPGNILEKMGNVNSCWWCISSNDDMIVGNNGKSAGFYSYDGDNWERYVDADSSSQISPWTLGVTTDGCNSIILTQNNNKMNSVCVFIEKGTRLKVIDISDDNVLAVMGASYINNRIILSCALNNGEVGLLEIIAGPDTILHEIKISDNLNISNIINNSLINISGVGKNYTVETLKELLYNISYTFGAKTTVKFFNAMYLGGDNPELNRFVMNGTTLVCMSDTTHNLSAEDEGFFIDTGTTEFKVSIDTDNIEKTCVIIKPLFDTGSTPKLIFRTRHGIPTNEIDSYTFDTANKPTPISQTTWDDKFLITGM